MYFIDVPDENDSMSELAIDDEVYLLRFTYNPKFDYWSFGLYDIEENPIIAMTRIVPNYPIFDWYKDTELPDGIFGCISDSETVGRDAFKNKTAEFVYIPNEELVADNGDEARQEYDREG